MTLSPSRRHTVLLIDDDDVIRESLSLCLEGLSPSPWILQARNGSEGVAQLAEHQVDLVITDLEMPVMDGFNFLARLANHRPRIPAMVITSHGNQEVAVQLRHHGVCQVIPKPFDCMSLQRLVSHQLQNRHGAVSGFSLTAVLQLIEIERKSCTVRLTKSILESDVEGALYFQAGKLMDAASQNHIGENAVRELISWPDPLIEIEKPAQVAEAQVRTSIAEFLVEQARAAQQDPIDPRAIKTSSLEQNRLVEAIHHLSGVVAIALFSWPASVLLTAVTSNDDEPLSTLTSCAQEIFAVVHRLEAVYGASEAKSLFWLGNRFLLVHAIGPDHCALIAADPEHTTAQILRQQLRSMLLPSQSG